MSSGQLTKLNLQVSELDDSYINSAISENFDGIRWSGMEWLKTNDLLTLSTYSSLKMADQFDWIKWP